MGKNRPIVFLVTQSPMNYQKSALAVEVLQQVGAQRTPHITMSPASDHSVTPARGYPSRGTTPSKSLTGCVLRLTRDTDPTLVERARYESHPAYVIAVPTRAWVVAPGCTAARLDVITSVPLIPAGG